MPLALVATLLISVAFLGGCAIQPVDGVPEQVLVPIVYVTDRNLNESAPPQRFYGGNRGEPQAGTATVAIATRRDTASPFADWQRWEPRPGGSRRRDELLSVTPATRAEIAPVLAASTDLAATGSVLVYVHGFRRRFDTSAVNFAKLVYQLSPDAVPILYSWPSTGNVFKYKDDVGNLEWSNGTLRSMLAGLLDARQIETIHVVAHSLGSFAFLEAIAAVAEISPATVRSKFGQILLISPDIARDRFERSYLPIIRENRLRVTIYAAENDVPLRTSRRVNKAERVGDAKSKVPLYPGTETVLVSEVVSILNSHDSHLEVADVQADIAYAINDDLAADDRPTLEPVAGDEGRYWQIKANNH